MKTSLDYLPKHKQKELSQIAAMIQNMCDDVEMIILFGSYARGDWKEESDLELHRKSGHKSDYDILVVTKKKETAHHSKTWNAINQSCKDLKQSTHSRIISHDLEHVNIQLAVGQYFFSDIKKEGLLLYDTGNSRLVKKRKLTPEEQQRIAQDHFDHWFENANDFWFGFEKFYETERYKKAAFHLHQTVESVYKAILLVFTNYNPNEHYLGMLRDMVIEQEPSLNSIFSQDTEVEREQFELLDYAYWWSLRSQISDYKRGVTKSCS